MAVARPVLAALALLCWLVIARNADAGSNVAVTRKAGCRQATYVNAEAPGSQQICCYYSDWLTGVSMPDSNKNSAFYSVPYCGKEVQFSKAAADYANFTSGSRMYNLCARYNCSETGLTATKRCCVYNDTAAAVSVTDASYYFNMPSMAVHLCPYSDTPTKAFGFNLPAAPLPTKSTPWASTATNPMTEELLSKCPDFSSAAGNFTVTSTTLTRVNFSLAAQTFKLPKADNGVIGMDTETPYVLHIQRKAAVQKLTLTISMYLDDNPSLAFYTNHVITVDNSFDPNSRRRTLLGAESGQWMHGNSILNDKEWAEVQLAATGRKLKQDTKAKAKRGQDPTRGAEYPGTIKDTFVIYYDSVDLSQFPAILGNKSYPYKKPATLIPYGVPTTHPSWFTRTPITRDYGYDGLSLIQASNSYLYGTPTTWVDAPNYQTNYTCPKPAGASPINGTDCLTSMSTCCGQPYQNDKFALYYPLPDIAYRGTKLTCPLRTDILLDHPVVLPQNARSITLVVHSIQAVLATNTSSSACGGVTQVLDPQEPAVYFTFMKAAQVKKVNGAGSRTASLPLAAGIVLLLGWLVLV